MPRLVSVDDEFNLPDSVNVRDTNLPANLQPAALSATIDTQVAEPLAAKLDKTEAVTSYDPIEVIPESAHRAYANIQTNTAIVTLRFDDSIAASATVADLLYARGLVGGFALIPDQFDTTGALTTAQAKAIQDLGHEIMAHNGDTLATAENFYGLTVGAANALEANGMYVQTFVQPGAWDSGPYKFDSLAKYDTVAGRLIKSRFLCSLAYVLDYAGGASSYLVRPIPAQNRHGAAHWTGDSVTTLANWQAPVNRAIAVGGAVEMLLHPNSLDASGRVTTATFTAFLDWLAAQQAAGTVTVLTPTAALMARKGAREELLPDPDFTKYVADPTVATWGVGASVVFSDAEAGATGKQALTTSSQPASVSVFYGESLRSIRVSGKAKSVDATGNATIRMLAYDAAGTIIKNISRAFPVNNTGYTNVVTNYATIPGAVKVTITWYCPSSTASGVKWANTSLMRT